MFENFGIILSTNFGWSLALAVSFFGATKFALGLMSDGAKESLSLWLMGSVEESWADSFTRMFDRCFGEKHFTLSCFIKSALVSITTVTIMWLIFDASELLTLRAGSNLDLVNVLAIGLVINVLADYISLFETRFLLRNIHHATSVLVQCIILVFDFALTAIIILFPLWLYGEIESEQINDFDVELVLGGFSAMSIFFFSTFVTSIWSWGYIFSTWFMRLFCRIGLSNFLDVEKRPGLMVAFIGSVCIFFGSILTSIPLSKTESQASIFDEFLCSISGQVCKRLSEITDEYHISLSYLASACEQSIAVDECYARVKETMDVNPEIALPLAEASCSGGDARGCVNLGFLLEGGIGTVKDQARSRLLYRRGCDLGQAVGCSNLGKNYLRGEGVEIDNGRALELFAMSCEIGGASGCSNVGAIYRDGIGVPENTVLAQNFYTKGCDLGSAWGCADLGVLYLQDGDRVGDLVVHDLFQQACDGGISRGCTNLGTLYEHGSGVDVDYTLARASYRNGCELGSAVGCGNLAFLIASGLGGDLDYGRARELFQLGCDQGAASACTNLGVMSRNGLGGDVDNIRARGLYEVGCESGHADGCNNLGHLFENGFGINVDMFRAVKLYRLACDGGSSTGCSNLARLEP